MNTTLQLCSLLTAAFSVWVGDLKAQNCPEPASYDYQTIADGNWNAASTWLNGNIPDQSFETDKNILILHHVTNPNGNIHPASNSILVIKNGGSLTEQQINMDKPYAKIIINGGSIKAVSGNFQVKNNSSICASNGCFKVGNDFKFENTAVITFINTGIQANNNITNNSATISGSNIRLWSGNDIDSNGGTWAGNTISAWYAGNNFSGFSGAPQESNITMDPCSAAYSICYKPYTAAGVGVTPPGAKIGISSLDKPLNDGSWPMIRKGAHIALESRTKGFVITRVASPETSILSPVEGMMVYDTTLNCIRIYTVDPVTPSNTGWKCFNKQACPE